MTSNSLVIAGLELQGVVILLGCISAYSIWRTLKEMSLANQASVSERLASQGAWMHYVRDHYSASRVVREFVAEHRHWYADVVVNFVDTAPGLIKRTT